MKPSDLLQKHGWCQGAHAMSVNDKRCDIDSGKATKFDIVGAMFAADELPAHPVVKVLKAINQRREELRDALPADAPLEVWRKANKYIDRLTLWNDEPDRTKWEVINVLRSAGL